MIETKEQWEEWREAIEKFPNLRMWPDDMRKIAETIEALREVARALGEYGLTENYDERRQFEEEMWDKLNALPDWITE